MSPARVFVTDASLWVARLVPQDEHHQRVKLWLEAKQKQGALLLSPGLLLVEVAEAVARRTGDATLALRTVENLQQLPNLRLVEMERGLVQESARLAAELSLRGADAFYVALAKRLALPLATLDGEQRERGSKVVSIEVME